jgi:hypothetical protein
LAIRGLLRLTTLDGIDWLVVFTAAALPAVIGQAIKLAWPPRAPGAGDSPPARKISA